MKYSRSLLSTRITDSNFPRHIKSSTVNIKTISSASFLRYWTAHRKLSLSYGSMEKSTSSQKMFLITANLFSDSSVASVVSPLALLENFKTTVILTIKVLFK